MGVREWLMLFALSILWGGSFFFVEIAVSELPPLVIVLCRVGLAASVLWAIILARGIALPHGREVWLTFLGMGMLNNAIPFFLIVWGQQSIASGLASILNATTPIFTVVIAHFFLADEQISTRKFVGILIAIAGVVILVLPSIGLGETSTLLGQLAILGATISYGFASVFGRRFKSLGISPMMSSAGQLTGSTVLLLPVTLVMHSPLDMAMPGTSVLIALILLAVACTALAYLLFFSILSSAGATNIALVTLLVPVTAVLLGVLVLGEKLSANHLIGMAGISLGLLVLDGRLFRRHHM